MVRSRTKDPLQQYRFQVDFSELPDDFDNNNGNDYGFVSISGLETEIDTIEYRDGSMDVVHKIPGIKRGGTATFEKGYVPDDEEEGGIIEELHEAAKDEDEDAFRCTITIKEKDSSGTTKRTHELEEAWVSRYQRPDMDASSSEIAIEVMEVEYEDIETKQPEDDDNGQ